MVSDFSARIKSDELSRWLKAMDALIKKMESGTADKVFAAFGTVIAADIFRHFKNQEGPDGPWQPWSPNYKRRSGMILQFNGTLRNSIQASNYRVDKGTLLWFSNAETVSGFPYAYAHDNGERPRKKLPQRKFMWISRGAFDKIAMITLNALVDV